jgi:prepilin-type N-terminal cleavage/methylation domain-containing protein
MKRKHWVQQWIRRSRQVAGFTLLELLVVIFMVGILAAIAAPSWEKLLSRQRTGTAREQVAQAMRAAQNKARQSRTPQIVYFDPNTAGQTPRLVTLAYPKNTATAIPVTSITSWENVGQGDIPKGSLQMFVKSGATVVTAPEQRRIIFDADGAVDQSITVPFSVVIRGGGITDPGPSDRCAIVQTKLGSIRSGEGSECS